MQIFKSFVALALAASALAAHAPSKVHPNPPQPTPTCSAGTTALCCNSVSYADQGYVGLLLGLLNVHVSHPSKTLVGVTCNPLGKGKNACREKAVCCKKDEYHGVVAVDCTAL